MLVRWDSIKYETIALSGMNDHMEMIWNQGFRNDNEGEFGG